MDSEYIWEIGRGYGMILGLVDEVPYQNDDINFWVNDTPGNISPYQNDIYGVHIITTGTVEGLSSLMPANRETHGGNISNIVASNLDATGGSLAPVVSGLNSAFVGYAPESEILTMGIDSFLSESTVPASALLEAMMYGILQEVSAFNLSFGSTGPFRGEFEIPTSGIIGLWRGVLDMARMAEIPVFTSAGNSGLELGKTYYMDFRDGGGPVPGYLYLLPQNIEHENLYVVGMLGVGEVIERDAVPLRNDGYVSIPITSQLPNVGLTGGNVIHIVSSSNRTTPVYLGMYLSGVSNFGDRLDFTDIGIENVYDPSDTVAMHIIGTSFSGPIVASKYMILRSMFPDLPYEDVINAFKDTAGYQGVAHRVFPGDLGVPYNSFFHDTNYTLRISENVVGGAPRVYPASTITRAQLASGLRPRLFPDSTEYGEYTDILSIFLNEYSDNHAYRRSFEPMPQFENIHENLDKVFGKYGVPNIKAAIEMLDVLPVALTHPYIPTFSVNSEGTYTFTLYMDDELRSPVYPLVEFVYRVNEGAEQRINLYTTSNEILDKRIATVDLSVDDRIEYYFLTTDLRSNEVRFPLDEAEWCVSVVNANNVLVGGVRFSRANNFLEEYILLDGAYDVDTDSIYFDVKEAGISNDAFILEAALNQDVVSVLGRYPVYSVSLEGVATSQVSLDVTIFNSSRTVILSSSSLSLTLQDEETVPGAWTLSGRLGTDSPIAAFPNPFYPRNTKTNIIFHTSDSITGTFSVYTRNGVLLFQDNVNGKYSNCLDRMHVLLEKFLKGLCEKHEITLEETRNNKLGYYYTEYRNHLIENKAEISEMTLNILKNVSGYTGKFNEVRNNASLAVTNFYTGLGNIESLV